MGLNFDFGDNVALDELVFGSSDQIIFRTDREGFVCGASPEIRHLGYPLGEMLIGPHIRDLAAEQFRPAVEAAFGQTLDGEGPVGWIEFRCGSQAPKARWYALKVTALRDAKGAINGTIGILRNVARTKHLEERLFRARLTDPLTGLTNRQAWLHMLDHLAGGDASSSLALVEIDYFKAINLRFGLATGDRFLVDFADYLRTALPEGISISRVGASRFGLLFPGWTQGGASSVCSDIVAILDGVQHPEGKGRMAITASIGLVKIGAEIDTTVRAAEAALGLARAMGGNTVADPPILRASTPSQLR